MTDSSRAVVSVLAYGGISALTLAGLCYLMVLLTEEERHPAKRLRLTSQLLVVAGIVMVAAPVAVIDLSRSQFAVPAAWFFRSVGTTALVVAVLSQLRYRRRSADPALREQNRWLPLYLVVVSGIAFAMGLGIGS